MANSKLISGVGFTRSARLSLQQRVRFYVAGITLCLVALLSGCQATPNPAPQMNPAHLRHAAQIAYQQGDLLSAESLLLNNVTRFEKDVDSWFLLGNVYLRTAQYPAAQRAYLQASKYKPEQAEIWHNLAVVYVRMATQSLLEGSLHSAADFEPLLGWLLQMQGAQSTPK